MSNAATKTAWMPSKVIEEMINLKAENAKKNPNSKYIFNEQDGESFGERFLGSPVEDPPKKFIEESALAKKISIAIENDSVGKWRYRYETNKLVCFIDGEETGTNENYINCHIIDNLEKILPNGFSYSTFINVKGLLKYYLEII